MLPKLVVALAAAAASVAQAETIFRETFDDADWASRWVASTWKPADEVGKFEHVVGMYYPDAGDDKAIKTSQDARFYALTAKFDQPLDNKDKDLYLSYLVQHEQKPDCGGAYIKLLPADVDQSNFGGESPYNVMFGPDICGAAKKTHAILTYARPGEDAVNMDHKDEIRTESDSDAHVFSFVLKRDNTYDVKIDGKSVKAGDLAANWPFQPEKEIPDPDLSKPADWVDDEQIPDPAAQKPADWDDEPNVIPDPTAVKPEDWDDEDDGEWEPAMVANPAYKGEWKAPLVANPAYKGEWVHPLIANPEYFEDEALYHVAANVGAIGFELWQVKSGTLFDDILVTTSEAEFLAHEEQVLDKVELMQKKKKQLQDEEKAKKEAEAKAKEAEEKEKGAENDEEEEDVEEEEEEDVVTKGEQMKEKVEEVVEKVKEGAEDVEEKTVKEGAKKEEKKVEKKVEEEKDEL
uniref:Calreticulin n=1 Tax=Peronospora matthiolae TaxID=2874970 RepID=A0AAV1U1D0_9STRA